MNPPMDFSLQRILSKFWNFNVLQRSSRGREKLARALGLAPRQRGALGLERVPGLAAWLATVGLEAREAEVSFAP